MLPVAVTLWYMSMDLTPFPFGGDAQNFFSDQAKFVSMWFGLLMTLLAFWVDVRTRQTRDFAFWLYIFGVLTSWQRREAAIGHWLRSLLPAALRELVEHR